MKPDQQTFRSILKQKKLISKTNHYAYMSCDVVQKKENDKNKERNM